MQSYIPSDEFKKNRSVEQQILHLQQDHDRLPFPMGSSSPSRTALGKIIAFWKALDEMGPNEIPKGISIPSDLGDVAIQLEEIKRELEQIVKKSDEESLPVKVDLGGSYSGGSLERCISKASVESLEEYISNLALVLDLYAEDPG